MYVLVFFFFYYFKFNFSSIIYSVIIKGYKIAPKNYILLRVRYVTTLHLNIPLFFRWFAQK